MNRMQRMVLEIVLTLVVFSLISAMPFISKAESVNTITSDSALTGLTAPKSAMPESIWGFGIALVGLAMIVRRKVK